MLELPGMGDPPLWFLRRLGVVSHYFFLNSTTDEQTFIKDFRKLTC